MYTSPNDPSARVSRYVRSDCSRISSLSSSELLEQSEDG
jgi:hypothetical protein